MKNLNYGSLLCSPVFVPQIVGGELTPVPLVPATVNVSVLKLKMISLDIGRIFIYRLITYEVQCKDVTYRHCV